MQPGNDAERGSERIRVLDLRDTARMCGPGKTILETANHMDRERFSMDIGVFVRRPDERNEYIDIVRRAGHTAIPVLFGGYGDFGAVRRLRNLIDQGGYHIVHSHEYISDMLTLLAAPPGVRRISTCHGWIRNSIRSKLSIGLQKRVLRRFDRVLAVSRAIRDELESSGVAASRIDLLYNAIVVDNYRRDVSKGVFRGTLGVPDDCHLMGCVGRLSEEKGQADCLAAFARVAPALPKVHLVFVGEGPSSDQLKQLAATHGLTDRIRFAGYRHDMPQVYRDLDSLILTSHTEGFPNVLLEALTMNVPVLATRVGGVEDLLDDRRTGRLVHARDVDAIADAMQWLVTDPARAKRTAEAGRRKVLEDFDFRVRTKKMEEIYFAERTLCR